MLFYAAYQAFGQEYLLFDPRRADCDEHAVTQLALSRSFCLSADRILVGPLGGPGWCLRVFCPDGTECFCCPAAARVFAHYLREAGYTDCRRIAVRSGSATIPVCVGSGSIVCKSTSSVEQIRRALSL